MGNLLQGILHMVIYMVSLVWSFLLSFCFCFKLNFKTKFIMNFHILIFACVVVLQIEKHECKFAELFQTCGDPQNGKGCLAWSPSAVCQGEIYYECENVCFPDFFSCCDCVRRKKPRCFPSSSKVNLKNGKSVPMSDLQLGDQVQTGKKVYFNLNLV